jgi:hypothetical protein
MIADNYEDSEDEYLFYDVPLLQSATIAAGVSNEITGLIAKAKNVIRESKSGNLLISMKPKEGLIIFSHKDIVDNSYFEITCDAIYDENAPEDQDSIYLTSAESLDAEVCRKNYEESTLSFSRTQKQTLMIQIALQRGRHSSAYKSERLFLYDIPEDEQDLHIDEANGCKWRFKMSTETSRIFIDLIRLFCKWKKEADVWFKKLPNGKLLIEYRFQENVKNVFKLPLPYETEEGEYDNHVPISWSYKSIGKFLKLIKKKSSGLIFIIDENDDLIIQSQLNSITVMGKFDKIFLDI